MTTTQYVTENFVAGSTLTRQAKLAADTYHRGMPLQYSPTVPTAGVAGTNTGDGTVTVVSHIKTFPLIEGDYVLECIVAVTNGGTFKLTDPAGNILDNSLVMTAGAGAATSFISNGLSFTITDGDTDFIVGDTFSLTVSEGDYSFLTDGLISGFFFENESRVLSSAAKGTIFRGGEVYEGGIVDDSGDVMTITETMIADWAARGFYIVST